MSTLTSRSSTTNKTSTTRIAVLGAGWLGNPLTQFLLQRGHLVLGIKRSPSDAQNSTIEICPTPKSLEQTLNEFSPTHLIICWGKGKSNDFNYVKSMESLQFTSKIPSIQQAIYTSSTGIYEHHHGETIQEKDLTPPHSSRSLALFDAENHFQNIFQEKGLILRLAGLYDLDRIPGYKSWKEGKTRGPLNAWVNLIHREDVIRAIERALQHPLSGVYHLSDHHPLLRSDLLALFDSKFKKTSDSNQNQGKIINPSKFIRDFDFQFKVPNAIDWLKDNKEVWMKAYS